MLATKLALGISTRFITEQTGITKTAWNNYENRISRPNLLDCIRFCARFGITLDWVYLGNPSALPHELAAKIMDELKRLEDEEALQPNK